MTSPMFLPPGVQKRTKLLSLHSFKLKKLLFFSFSETTATPWLRPFAYMQCSMEFYSNGNDAWPPLQCVWLGGTCRGFGGDNYTAGCVMFTHLWVRAPELDKTTTKKKQPKNPTTKKQTNPPQKIMRTVVRGNVLRKIELTRMAKHFWRRCYLPTGRCRGTEINNRPENKRGTQWDARPGRTWGNSGTKSIFRVVIMTRFDRRCHLVSLQPCLLWLASVSRRNGLMVTPPAAACDLRCSAQFTPRCWRERRESIYVQDRIWRAR